MEKKTHFPLFINTKDKKVLVIGGGEIAFRRIKTLLEFDFLITVISLNIKQEIKALPIKYIETEFNEKYIEDYFFVLACTNDDDINKEIVKKAREKGILANSCSNKNDCDFFFPAIITEDKVTIGIVGVGTDHSHTKQIKEKLLEVLR